MKDKKVEEANYNDCYYLMNLNEDPLLNGKIKYVLSNGKILKSKCYQNLLLLVVKTEIPNHKLFLEEWVFNLIMHS